jgi:hypothetical protein
MIFAILLLRMVQADYGKIVNMQMGYWVVIAVTRIVVLPDLPPVVILSEIAVRIITGANVENENTFGL